MTFFKIVDVSLFFKKISAPGGLQLDLAQQDATLGTVYFLLQYFKIFDIFKNTVKRASFWSKTYNLHSGCSRDGNAARLPRTVLQINRCKSLFSRWVRLPLESTIKSTQLVFGDFKQRQIAKNHQHSHLDARVCLFDQNGVSDYFSRLFLASWTFLKIIEIVLFFVINLYFFICLLFLPWFHPFKLKRKYSIKIGFFLKFIFIK